MDLLFKLYAVHATRLSFRALTADKLKNFIEGGDNIKPTLSNHIENNPNFAICFLENRKLDGVLSYDALERLIRKNLHDEGFINALQHKRARRIRHTLGIDFRHGVNPLVTLASRDQAYRDEILADEKTLQRLTNIDIATISAHCKTSQAIQQIGSAYRIGDSIDQKVAEVDLYYQRALKEAKRDIDGLFNFFENAHYAEQLALEDFWQVLEVYENNQNDQEGLSKNVNFINCVNRQIEEIRNMVCRGNKVSHEKLKKLFSNKEIKEMHNPTSHDLSGIPLTKIVQPH